MSTDTQDHLDPWFDDGNIILSSEGKLFRVHRSILSSYSEVFRDMFACPHSHEAERELVEGCPVIHVHDAASDIQAILKAMYDRSYMLSCHDEMPFSVVSAFLRLGRKYNIPQLFSEAKARIHPPIEPTLSMASGLRGETAAPWPNVCQGITQSDPYNIQLMNLLREMDLTEYLPMIMFQCILCAPAKPLADGHQLEDGSTCSLSALNLRSYVLIQDTLRKFRVQLSNAFSVDVWNCCRVQCTSHLFCLCTEELTEVQPFCPWRGEWDGWFCGRCRASLRSMRDTAIIEAWEELPTAFGFASWEEVKMKVDWGTVVPVCHRGF